MAAKLVLTIEQRVAEEAQKYASRTGKSLSLLIEDYLRVMIEGGDNKSVSKTPLTDSLRGAFRGDADVDYKEELTKALENKYL